MPLEGALPQAIDEPEKSEVRSHKYWDVAPGLRSRYGGVGSLRLIFSIF